MSLQGGSCLENEPEKWMSVSGGVFNGGLTLQTKLFCCCKVGSKVFLSTICGFGQLLSTNNVDCLAELGGGGHASSRSSSRFHGRCRFVCAFLFLSCVSASDMSGDGPRLGLTQPLSELWVIAADVVKVNGIASKSNEERNRRRGDESRR